MIAVYTLFDLVSSCPIFFVINFEQEEAVAQTCSVKNVFLDISQNFEFCEISKNTFFYRTPLAAASEQVYYERFLSFSAFCIVNIVKTSWISFSDFKVEVSLSIQHP